MTYIISELNHPNSISDGEEYKTKSLSNAKRFATKSQVFYGTFMCIDDARGNRISTRGLDGKWEDTNDK